MRILILLASLLILAFLSSPLYAQTPTLDDQVNRIAKNLYCPVCPNTPLDVCNTQACVDWRNDIKRMLLEGKSEQEIRDYFVARYGFQVLGAPPAEGFNWLAYLLPAFGLMVGIAVAWFSMRAWLTRRASNVVAADTTTLPREYLERLEKELKEW